MYKIEYDIYCPRNSFEKYKNIGTELIFGGKKDKTPFFSIMIPTYKRADTIVLSVHSALEQVGFDDYEIIVVDNESSDVCTETRDVMAQIKSDKLFYYVNKSNLGMCGNWNRCVELCSGQYIVMLHDDDILSPYCLKTLYEVIEQANKPTIVGVGYENFKESSVPIFRQKKKVSYIHIEKKDFFWGESLNIAGLTFQRDFIMKMGGFADEYYPNEDSYFIYQAIVHGKVIKIHQVMAGYRVENNLSLKGDTLKKIICMTEKMREVIATHEPFAQRFMKNYDVEYLYDYVIGANQYWSQKIDYHEILEACQMKRKQIKTLKLLYVKWKKLYYKKITLRLKRKYQTDIHYGKEVI